ncbi:MAG: hypothetical protein GY899_14070 [Verrucomicrobiaceae bacterium]|nr:hypothetical protein [Verrucomicrobiaceae bacterium]
MEHSLAHTRSASSGSAILMGLVVMTLGTFGVAAWISLLNSRAIYIQSMEVSSNHRIARVNARAVADEFIYRHALAKLAVPAGDILIPDGLGRVEMSAADTAPLASLIRPSSEVITGMANGYGYQVELPVKVTINVDHDNDPETLAIPSIYSRAYQLKSRAPQLTGDLLVLHRPITADSGEHELSGQVRVYGNTVLWSSRVAVVADSGVRTERYTTFSGGASSQSKVRNLEGRWIAPANYPLVTNTAGEVEGGNAYDGRLNVIDPGAHVPWSMKNQLMKGSHIVLSGDKEYDSGRGARSDGAGNIHVTIGDSHLTSVLIGNHVRTINLHGQDDALSFANAESLSAIMIVIHQTAGSGRTLRNINLRGSNNRRLLLGIKREDSNNAESRLTFADADEDPRWRLMLIAERCRMTAGNSPHGVVTLVGGIRTDSDFEWSGEPGKILEIRRETDAGILERLAPRTAWLESYAN